MIKAQCDKVGARCAMYGTEVSGLPQLPQDKKISQWVMEVFCQEWHVPFHADKVVVDPGNKT